MASGLMKGAVHTKHISLRTGAGFPLGGLLTLSKLSLRGALLKRFWVTTRTTGGLKPFGQRNLAPFIGVMKERFHRLPV